MRQNNNIKFINLLIKSFYFDRIFNIIIKNCEKSLIKNLKIYIFCLKKHFIHRFN